MTILRHKSREVCVPWSHFIYVYIGGCGMNVGVGYFLCASGKGRMRTWCRLFMRPNCACWLIPLVADIPRASRLRARLWYGTTTDYTRDSEARLPNQVSTSGQGRFKGAL